MKSNLRHADYVLIPVSTFPASSRDDFIPLLGITPVPDWQTLCIYAQPELADNDFNASAVVIFVIFYQLTGNGVIPTNNNAVVVGGRTLCVGASESTDFYYPSTLNCRIPIIAPFVEILLWFPETQTNTSALQFSAWLTNEPSYNAYLPNPNGLLYAVGTPFGGDTMMGLANAGGLSDPTTGIYVPSSTLTVTELAQQSLGTARFSYVAQAVSGDAPSANEIAVWVCNKSEDDTSGTTMNEVIYPFGNQVQASQGGIPLTGFRQSVAILNFTSPARDLVVHTTVYPELV